MFYSKDFFIRLLDSKYSGLVIKGAFVGIGVLTKGSLLIGSLFIGGSTLVDTGC
jgi:hypothetical protein